MTTSTLDILIRQVMTRFESSVRTHDLPHDDISAADLTQSADDVIILDPEESCVISTDLTSEERVGASQDISVSDLLAEDDSREFVFAAKPERRPVPPVHLHLLGCAECGKNKNAIKAAHDTRDRAVDLMMEAEALVRRYRKKFGALAVESTDDVRQPTADVRLSA